ncbi:hypothetical protein HDU98_009204 [Podochytrium sp. JEL0797]|nr:hypothetical protein HDU98_009204 [Podochytrium sp. JEL0797]
MPNPTDTKASARPRGRPRKTLSTANLDTSHRNGDSSNSPTTPDTGDFAPGPLDDYYECLDCWKKFRKRDTLRVHMYSHLDKKPFHCDFEGCVQSYTTLYSLKIHIMSHTGERPFQCTFPSCTQAFKTKQNLELHSKKHFKPPKEPKHACVMCQAKFVTKNERHIHETQTCPERKFPCPFCSAVLSTFAEKTVHVADLCELRMPSCPLCQKKLPSKHALDVHVADFCEKRPIQPPLFPCGYCDAKFASVPDVNHHLMNECRQRPVVQAPPEFQRPVYGQGVWEPSMQMFPPQPPRVLVNFEGKREEYVPGGVPFFMGSV